MTLRVFKTLAATVITFVQNPGEPFLGRSGRDLHCFSRPQLMPLAIFADAGHQCTRFRIDIFIGLLCGKQFIKFQRQWTLGDAHSKTIEGQASSLCGCQRRFV